LTKLSRSQLPILLLPLPLSLLVAFLAGQGWLGRWQEQALDWQFRF